MSEFEIQIQSPTIEFYSAKLLINAYFTGLRYFMFHWPLISAVIGISLNLFFTTIISLISWYQLIHSDEYNNYRLNISQELSFVDDHDCEYTNFVSTQFKKRKTKHFFIQICRLICNEIKSKIITCFIFTLLLETRKA